MLQTYENKIANYIMVNVEIKKWISKRPASSDLSTSRNSDSNLPIRKGTIRMSRDPYNCFEVGHFSRNDISDE